MHHEITKALYDALVGKMRFESYPSFLKPNTCDVLT